MRLAAGLLVVLFVVPISGATPPCECSPEGEWAPNEGPVEKVAWAGDSWGPTTTTVLGEAPMELLFVTVLWANDATIVYRECATRTGPTTANLTVAGMLLAELDEVTCPEDRYGYNASVHAFNGGTAFTGLPQSAGASYGDSPQCIFVQVTTKSGSHGNIPSELPTRPEDCELAKLNCSSCGPFVIPAARGPAILALLAALALLRR